MNKLCVAIRNNDVTTVTEMFTKKLINIDADILVSIITTISFIVFDDALYHKASTE